MTFEEYKEGIERINLQARKYREKLAKEFAEFNNNVANGDIISNGWINIQVTGYRIGYYGEKPECVYRGLKVKKDLTLFQRGGKAEIWRSNIKKHIVSE